MRALQRNRRAEAYAIANASGAATAVINIPIGPSWEVKQISISTGTSATLPSAATYVGTSSAGIFLSSTLVGNSDTDSFPNITVRSGESLCCVWSLVTVGVQCKMTVVYDEVGY